MTRQAAIDALTEAREAEVDFFGSLSYAESVVDLLDAHPEAAAALRAYLAPEDLGAAWAEAIDLPRPDRTTEGGIR